MIEETVQVGRSGPLRCLLLRFERSETAPNWGILRFHQDPVKFEGWQLLLKPMCAFGPCFSRLARPVGEPEMLRNGPPGTPGQTK